MNAAFFYNFTVYDHLIESVSIRITRFKSIGAESVFWYRQER
jgi:hypothetical protein